jgi:hypothetical protein
MDERDSIERIRTRARRTRRMEFMREDYVMRLQGNLAEHENTSLFYLNRDEIYDVHAPNWLLSHAKSGRMFHFVAYILLLE